MGVGGQLTANAFREEQVNLRLVSFLITFVYMNQKEKDISQKIKNRIKEMNPEAIVILFGSHAKGQSHKDSDWDILILLNQPKVNRNVEKEYREAMYEIELIIDEPISTFVFSLSDWEQKHKMTPLYENIKREGIYL